MMKTHRFELGRFLPSEADDSGNIYIDWPAIHRQAGLDCVQWLKSQDASQCQIVVEQRPAEVHLYMMAEIYSDKLATLYSLLWAK
jgi:hypothetical protein